MVFPIGDDNSDRLSFPFETIVLIVLNVLVFIFLQGAGENLKFTYAFSTVPQEIVTNTDEVTEDRVVQDPAGNQVRIPGLQPTPIPVYLTILTSMFMHGGWAHLLGNMWFLWIFGDNVEDDMGKLRFPAFYLLCGVIAAMAHVLTNMSGESALIPCLGASGAISGVMGAYLVLHPKRRVLVILFRFITHVPGWVAVGIWAAFQVISGLGMLGGQTGGVAYGAHIGGFIAGAALAYPFVIGRPRGVDPNEGRSIQWIQ